MRSRFGFAAVGLATLAVLVSACGGGGSKIAPTPVTPDRTVTLQAKNVKFSPDTVTVPSGSIVELRLENMDGTEHDLQVDGLDANVMSGGSVMPAHGGSGGMQMVAVHTMANQMASVVFMANKKGTYNFNCTIAGHKEAGMVGTLTVE